LQEKKIFSKIKDVAGKKRKGGEIRGRKDGEVVIWRWSESVSCNCKRKSCLILSARGENSWEEEFLFMITKI
jgi:hypothetical protein